MELPVCSEEEQLHEEEQKSNEEKFREAENIKSYERCHDRINELLSPELWVGTSQETVGNSYQEVGWTGKYSQIEC